MAISGVNFTLGVDGSKFISGMKNAQGSINDFSNSVQKEITNKLKYAFSMAAIEEATRRTGQWAQELNNTAKAMGIGTEALQTLELLARKTGTPKDAVVGMFESISNARDEALKGNQDMIMSFSRLGVSIEDLQTMTKEELFGTTQEGIAKAAGKDKKGNQIPLSEADNQTRAAAKMVTGGTPENFIMDIQKELEKAGGGAEAFGKITEKEKEEGNIMPEQAVADLAKVFSDIKDSFHDIFIQLAPILGMLLSLFSTAVTALGGIVEMIKDIFNVVVGVLTGDSEKIKTAMASLGLLIMNIGFGFAKALTSLFDLLTRSILSLISWIPGMKKTTDNWKASYGNVLTDSVKIYQDEANKAYKQQFKTSDKTSKRGEAMGEMLPAIIGGGGALTKGIANEMAGIAEKIGMKGTANVLNKAGEFAGGVAGKSSEEIKSMVQGSITKGMQNLEKGLDQLMAKKGMVKGQGQFAKMGEKEWTKDASGNLVRTETAASRQQTAEYNLRRSATAKSPEGRALLSKEVKSIQEMFGGLGGKSIGYGASIMGIVASFLGGKDKEKGTPPTKVKPILPPTGFFGETKGGETSMLKIGGIFGSNFQSRMIKLTQQMVNLLAAIQTNTQARRAEGYYEQPISRGIGQAGGF